MAKVKRERESEVEQEKDIEVEVDETYAVWCSAWPDHRGETGEGNVDRRLPTVV